MALTGTPLRRSRPASSKPSTRHNTLPLWAKEGEPVLVIPHNLFVRVWIRPSENVRPAFCKTRQSAKRFPQYSPWLRKVQRGQSGGTMIAIKQGGEDVKAEQEMLHVCYSSFLWSLSSASSVLVFLSSSTNL